MITEPSFYTIVDCSAGDADMPAAALTTVEHRLNFATNYVEAIDGGRNLLVDVAFGDDAGPKVHIQPDQVMELGALMLAISLPEGKALNHDGILEMLDGYGEDPRDFIRNLRDLADILEEAL